MLGNVVLSQPNRLNNPNKIMICDTTNIKNQFQFFNLKRSKRNSKQKTGLLFP